jgi:hypothetical protein
VIDVDRADFLRIRVPQHGSAFSLSQMKSFRSFGSQLLPDQSFQQIDSKSY